MEKIEAEIVDNRNLEEVMSQLSSEGYEYDVREIVQKYEPGYDVRVLYNRLFEESDPNSQLMTKIAVIYPSKEPAFTVELFVDPPMGDVAIDCIEKCDIVELGEEKYNLMINELRSHFGTIEEEIFENKHFPKKGGLNA